MIPAIAELYRVFEPYRLGDDFEGCSCCVSPRETALLASKPLRTLQPCDLDRYAFKAISTWGGIREYKHFLPRLLDLTFDQLLEFLYPEVVLSKLAYAEWTTWPKIEQDAVQSFLISFWTHQLRLNGDFPYDVRIETALYGLAGARVSLKPYLEIWENAVTEISALHLSQLIGDFADEIMTTGRVSLSGDPAPQSDEIIQSNEIIQWLRSDAAKDLLLKFRDAISKTFPLVLTQLDGIRAACVAR